jgi:hypothetical protein
MKAHKINPSRWCLVRHVKRIHRGNDRKKGKGNDKGSVLGQSLKRAPEDLKLEPLVEFLAGFWEQAYLLEAQLPVQGF